jgi:hypothetical protein
MISFFCAKCQSLIQTHCPPGTKVECRKCGVYSTAPGPAFLYETPEQKEHSNPSTDVDVELMALEVWNDPPKKNNAEARPINQDTSGKVNPPVPMAPSLSFAETTESLSTADSSKVSLKALYFTLAGGFLILIVLLGTVVFFLHDMDGEDENSPHTRKKALLFGGAPDTKRGDPELPAFELPLPFEAIATRERLKEIKVVHIEGKATFTAAFNVNDVSITWESLRRLKYDERLTRGGSTVLLLGNHGWFLSDGKIRTLEKDGLGFYQNFNYATILSNLIPLMEEGFRIEHGPDESIKGQECFSVRVNRIGHPELKMFFQKDTKLLSKAEFTGKFLKLGDLTFSTKDTFVEFYFSDYQISDGVKHWRKQEQWRDGNKFSELILSKVAFFNELDDSLFFVRGLERQVEEALAKEKDFERTIERITTALEEKDLKRARQRLATARQTNPSDHRLTGIEKKLEILENAVTETFVSEIQKGLEKEDFEEVIHVSRKGLGFVPGARKLQDCQLLAENARDVISYIRAARSNMDKREFDQGLSNLKNASSLLQNNLESKALAKFRETQLKNVAQIQITLAKDLFAIGKKKSEKARILNEAKGFDSAIKIGTDARSAFDQAREMLRLPGSHLEEDPRIEKEIENLDLIINNGIGQLSLKEARRFIKEGHSNLSSAKVDERKLLQAKKDFQSAGKCLIEAQKVGVDAKEDMDGVRGELKRIGKLIRPIFVDCSKNRDLSDLEAKGWSFGSNASKKWLQVNDTEGILQAKAIAFPKEFELKISLGLVNQRKEFSTNSWKYRAKLVHISLLSDDESKQVNISLGKNLDPRYSFADFVVMNVNKKSFDITSQVTKKGQESLDVIITRNRDYLSFAVCGKEIGGLSFNGKFNGLEIAVKNGLDSKQSPVLFPVVFGLSLSVLFPEEAKEGRLDPKSDLPAALKVYNWLPFPDQGFAATSR